MTEINLRKKSIFVEKFCVCKIVKYCKKIKNFDETIKSSMKCKKIQKF